MCESEWTGERMDGRPDLSIDGQTDRRMNGWMHEQALDGLDYIEVETNDKLASIRRSTEIINEEKQIS